MFNSHNTACEHFIPQLLTALWTIRKHLIGRVMLLMILPDMSVFVLCCGNFLSSRNCTWHRSSCQMLNTTGTSTLTRPLRQSGETLACHCHDQLWPCFVAVSAGASVFFQALSALQPLAASGAPVHLHYPGSEFGTLRGACCHSSALMGKTDMLGKQIEAS